MTQILAIVWLSSCSPAEVTGLSAAAVLAEQFDLAGALTRLRADASREPCDAVAGAIEYLEGLVAAPGAARQGGTDASLTDVRSAINALSRRAEGQRSTWHAASIALRAVAAAAQSEVAEMGLFLAEATRVESLHVAAGQKGIPFVTAHELAGDLWLQIHRYQDARDAYQRAWKQIGRTSRISLGLARSAARLKDTPSACGEYQSLLTWWGSRENAPPEIVEARDRFAALGCK
jgi:hypothetical protein